MIQLKPLHLFGKTKIGPPKVHQPGPSVLWGTGDIKGQITDPMYIRNKNKVTEVATTGPHDLIEWDDLVTAINAFNNWKQERESKAFP